MTSERFIQQYFIKQQVKSNMMDRYGHEGPLDLHLGFRATYLNTLKEATLDRLIGKWDGKSLWWGWDIKRVREIIKEQHWDEESSPGSS